MSRERRRAGMLQRRGRVMGLTIGASALFATSAQAQTLTVTTAGDDAPGGTCIAGSCPTLRDALTVANADTTADTITFASSVTGTITLGHGLLPISGTHGETINGPGASALAISGANTYQIFDITAPFNASVSEAINGLTLENGKAANPGGAIEDATSRVPLSLTGDTIENSTSSNSYGGGGIFSAGPLSLSNTTVSGNIASSGNGGGIALQSPPGIFTSTPANKTTISGSTITGNSAPLGGGIGSYRYFLTGGDVTITGNTQITGNHATASSYGGGAVDALFFRTLTVDGATISGNTSAGAAGGIVSFAKYGTTIRNTTVSGNTASSAGGGIFAGNLPFGKYSPIRIETSTISGNQAVLGAGVSFYDVGTGDPATIVGTTISGNHGGSNSFGGGIDVSKYVQGPFRLEDSTISGNTATNGAGISLGDSHHKQLINKYNSSNHTEQGNGSINFDDSTVSGNTAATQGGGIYLGQYTTSSNPAKQSGTAGMVSTIVSGNGAGDLARAAGSTSGGFNGSFSLIQAPGGAPLTNKQDLVGANPQLGPLKSNGGPTQTMLPAGTSPVIDQGLRTDNLTTDQRSLPRTVVNPLPEPPGGDGTDIGAVELPTSSVPGIFSVSINGTTLGGATRALLAGRFTPVRCNVRAGVIHSCIVKISVGKKLVATGSASGRSSPTNHIFLRVKPTAAGRKLLARHGLGIDVNAVASAGASGAPTVSGGVRLLAGPVFRIRTGKSTDQLVKRVLATLDQIAPLLTNISKVTCKAYTDQSTGDVALTEAQAKAGCKRLKKDGVKAKFKSVGKGHAPPAQRWLVIRFKY